MALEPLAPAAMRELLNGLVPGVPAATVDAIVERADGVPLYAVETVRAMLSEGRLERVGEEYRVCGELGPLAVPDTLRSLIASRLDALDAGDQALLRAASVVGQVFAAPMLAAVVGQDADEVERRLLALGRRELVELETDPASPERGQFKFMQSLIREVAYATMGRRERRGLHLAVARHYEGTGEDETAGALARHYLAAHEASAEGPEADAIAVQARLALSAAADRAASLGAHAQAVRYLDQALAVTSGAEDRAPLLDRAARSAGTAATADARRYGEAAIAAYREIGDRAGALTATARLGQVLLDATETTRAIEILEAAIPEAEALDDPTPLSEMLARLARGYMREGVTDKAVAAADRAIAIAEEHDLLAVAAEALVNKGSALSIMGRVHEPIALIGAALALAQKVGDRMMEVRIRNNYAVVLRSQDPQGTVVTLRETLDLARDLGDRAMYVWVAGTVAQDLFRMGRDWDAHIPVLQDALETATLRHDRLRMREHIAWFEVTRGEKLDTIGAELRAIVGDSDVPDDIRPVAALEATAASMMGRHEEAYQHVLRVLEVQTQAPHAGFALGLQIAIWGGMPARIAEMARRMLELPATEPLIRAGAAHARAALAAVEGRRTDAVAAIADAHALLTAVGARYMVARLAVEAAILLPDEPFVRELAAEARPILEELRARPDLERLDEALASVPAAATPTSATEAPTLQPG